MKFLLLKQIILGKYPVVCKWVYKCKLRTNGSLKEFKGRLVAKGYIQQEEIDYSDTFLPVAKLNIVRCLLALADSQDWCLQQIDVNNAFLHRDLHEEVYVMMPPSFAQLNDTFVCKLSKSLYGLNKHLSNGFLKSLLPYLPIASSNQNKIILSTPRPQFLLL